MMPMAWSGSGSLTVDGWQAHFEKTGERLHVYVDGLDVTDRCVDANIGLMYAEVYCHDPIGHHPDVTTGQAHVCPSNHDHVCTHRLRGVITVRPE